MQLQQAETARKANDTANAARLFRSVLAAAPGNLEAHANLGAIAFFQWDCLGAAPVGLDGGAQLGGGLAQTQTGLAELLRMDNKPAKAAAYLRLAVKSDPFNAEAPCKLSQIDRDLHQGG